MNQMSSAYKTDERVLKKIVNDNVKTTDENDQLSLMIYYKSTKTQNLIMKNNKVMQNKRQRTDEWLTVTNVVYKFSCPDEDCQLRKCSYIGATTTTMSRRITMHLNEGAPKAHMQQKHGRRITRTDFIDNTTIMNESQTNIDCSYTKPSSSKCTTLKSTASRSQPFASTCTADIRHGEAVQCRTRAMA